MNTKNKLFLSVASMSLYCGAAWAIPSLEQSGTLTWKIENISDTRYRSTVQYDGLVFTGDSSDTPYSSIAIGSGGGPGPGGPGDALELYAETNGEVLDYNYVDFSFVNNQSAMISSLIKALQGLSSLETVDGEVLDIWLGEFGGYFDTSLDSVTNVSVSREGGGSVDSEGYVTFNVELEGGGSLIIILDPDGYLRLSSIDKANVATMVSATRAHINQASSSILSGSHHRLLMDSSLNKDGWHTWVTGDFAGDQATDSAFASGEVGASRSVGSDDVRVGLGIGHMNASADGMFGSTSNLKGQYLVGEVDYRVQENVILSALAYYGDARATSHRNAADGSYTADGKTDVSSFAARFRADWKNAYQAGDVAFTPRVAYTYLGSTVDAYTETGAGAKNVSLEKQDSSAHEFRAGLDADYLLNEKTLLRGILEVAHLNGDNETVSGYTDVDSFTLPSDDSSSKDTWARLGVEAVRQVSDNANIHASIFRSTEGYDSTVSGAIGMNFWF